MTVGEGLVEKKKGFCRSCRKLREDNIVDVSITICICYRYIKIK